MITTATNKVIRASRKQRRAGQNVTHGISRDGKCQGTLVHLLSLQEWSETTINGILVPHEKNPLRKGYRLMSGLFFPPEAKQVENTGLKLGSHSWICRTEDRDFLGEEVFSISRLHQCTEYSVHTIYIL